ncbi:MAG: hypothetical protein KGI33_07735 [Thaumarchaeota archaeon]|nr:hypothetical protein [Nitrososphaerota archaeon]
MNKKILIAAVVAAIAISSILVGVKTTMGDKATELPGEEGAEKALHIQENGTSNSGESGESATNDSGESGP